MPISINWLTHISKQRSPPQATDLEVETRSRLVQAIDLERGENHLKNRIILPVIHRKILDAPVIATLNATLRSVTMIRRMKVQIMKTKTTKQLI